MRRYRAPAARGVLPPSGTLISPSLLGIQIPEGVCPPGTVPSELRIIFNPDGRSSLGDQVVLAAVAVRCVPRGHEDLRLLREAESLLSEGSVEREEESTPPEPEGEETTEEEEQKEEEGSFFFLADASF